jgi:xanthine dehydrogenase accessory factor
MVVSADAQFDTIGGGHLELQACAVAREMLAQQDQGHAQSSARSLQRFALGPSLGQCCGGVVQLAFERLDARAYADLRRLSEHRAARRDVWRLVPLEAPTETLLLDAAARTIGPAATRPPAFDRELPCHLLRDANGATWLVDPCRAERAHLVLFGAGHVGAALVRALAELPCQVTWVDEREDLFPPSLPANVKIECSDVPEAVVDEVAPGASFLVMTHSHALDQRLAEAILLRKDIAWFGLIGSHTKRVQFERRLRARGIGEERLNDMVCPIGIPGIRGKAPAVIAASVCAQLLQVWEALELQQAADIAA